ncbi:hypothetical protein [Spiroplasma ixodetis]|uniref:hypothetical protein n=1 Tax=Spiroplasma ixodetis TaxID=2141 RepID=UPI0025783C50|nr:hypothetical protein [Spiroplasma ixodetis]WJG69622.1 hypothetical protein SIXOD_v1c05320 [Spiroplasma ixodetis Y32]
MKHIIKCMAKDCNIKIEIELKRTWYLNDNNKRIYTYGRENKLSFCSFHTKQFNNALTEMKENISKENIENILKENINNKVNNELNKYKE